MYTVPAQVTIQAKTLIDAFEKGEFMSVISSEDDLVHPPRLLHPEMSVEELAEPGTAKKLLLVFEAKVQESVTSSLSPSLIGRGPNSAGVKLSLSNQCLADELDDKHEAVLLKECADRGGDAILDEQTRTENEITTSDASAVKIIVIEEVCSGTGAEIHDKSDMSGNISTGDQLGGKVQTSVTDIMTSSEILAEDSTSHFEAEHVTVKDYEAVLVTTAVDLTSQISDESNVQHPPPFQRHILVVTALKHVTSLHSALLDCTVKTIRDAGDDVIVTDVYKLREDSDVVEDYSSEQEKLLKAELVIFLYHTVLNTYQAALKEWLENVLVHNTAESVTGGDAPLKGKKSVIVVTTDAQRAATCDTVTDPLAAEPLVDINTHIISLQTGILRFAGLDVLQPQIISVMGAASDDESDKERIINAWSTRLLSIWDEAIISE